MTPAPPTLPTFFVIGAPKCGTTSLHHYLDQHPDVCMSSVKEPRIFAGTDFRERLGEYAELLHAAAPARGESSAVYSMVPHFPGVPARIAAVVPQARFIYLVRDPVDRAVAHYVQRVTDGTESRSLDEALGQFGDADNPYLAASRYGMQLRAYLEHFAADRIRVFDQEELRDATAAVLRRVFGFVGVDEGFRSPAFADRLNTREQHRVSTGLGRRLRGGRAFELARRLPLPSRPRRALRSLTSRRVESPELSPRLRASLTEALRPEADWLREFTGNRFAGWSV